MFSEINKRKELKVEAEETGFKRNLDLVLQRITTKTYKSSTE